MGMRLLLLGAAGTMGSCLLCLIFWGTQLQPPWPPGGWKGAGSPLRL